MNYITYSYVNKNHFNRPYAYWRLNGFRFESCLGHLYLRELRMWFFAYHVDSENVQ